ncbi:proline dehydrogenase family protein [Paenibacillus soyae]|uniref:proline dehydrogenase n=1 Tax=Paenibacillus soyae TaxID=2969249 RepID=A0A9X2SAE5_9BACL|nr:proline dehydrogenase family protein [Paenibacillus soyae]MCR2806569.1 proline dehydrogenase family protein [Paenibacillus soyae]
MKNSAEQQAAAALRIIARDANMKASVRQSAELYQLLWRAAQRFVTGETLPEALESAQHLAAMGYGLSLEPIGENTEELAACRAAVATFSALIEELGRLSLAETVSLDLSHIGLNLGEELARGHLTELAELARQHGVSLMIGMEESAKTEAILGVYKRTAGRYPNVGVTLQAHLHRSPADLTELMQYPGKIRLVKGAYGEKPEVALPRSEELNRRYLDMAERLLENGHPCSIATHDEALLCEIGRIAGERLPGFAEFEMLYGVRPERLNELRLGGNACRIYLPYGPEWYLYLCHRLAEHPNNIFRALTDIVSPTKREEELYHD